ncbi:TPA: Dot/Icm T4SS effector LegC7/YlfA [Legionella pneumophila]
MATNETELQVLIQHDSKSTITTSSLDSTDKDPKASTDTPEIESGSLAQIVDTQKQLSQVKESLESIVDSIAENPSLITRAASAWGELPMWQKVTGGLVLTAPTLAVGLFAHIGVLLVIGGVTGLTYTAGAIVLDDHHTCNVNIAKRLKEGLFGLADLLQITIEALDAIRKKFAEEIEKFKNENLRLTDNIDRLGNEVESLSAQVELYMEIEKMLRKDTNEMEQTVKKLQESTTKQTDLLEKNQKELSKIRKEYEKSQLQLAEKIAELHEVRLSLGLEVQKAKTVAKTLEGTVQTLTGTVIADEEQRVSFQKKLDGFLNDKQLSFDQVAERICKAEEELKKVKEELRQSNDRYGELLKRQEQQVERLEKLGLHKLERIVDKENVKPSNDPVHSGLLSHGIYSTPKGKVTQPKVEVVEDRQTIALVN